MKNLLLQFLATTVALLSFFNVSFAQSPNLGTAANYVLFTSVGAVGNTGVSVVNGNIGTNAGAITGFEPPTTVSGTTDSGNATTAQCAIDVQAAYDEIFGITPTSTGHAPAFGSGETLFPGVYAIAGAGSVAADLILDAQGDPNAIFIFKFGGAFTTGASTTVILINNASACNVFWIADGAIAMAASTTMKGTLIASNGAISMGASGSLEGRMLSTTGAASIYEVSASLGACLVLPLELRYFTGTCEAQNIVLKWSTATETNNDYFTIERSIEGVNWQVAGNVAGAGNSSADRNYTLTDRPQDKRTYFYRLKQTSFNGTYKYGNVVAVRKCGYEAGVHVTTYPNPSNGMFELFYTGDTAEVYSIAIFNAQGRNIYKSAGAQLKFDLSGKPPGIYIMQVRLRSKTQTMKIVID